MWVGGFYKSPYLNIDLKTQSKLSGKYTMWRLTQVDCIPWQAHSQSQVSTKQAVKTK